jgi:hypothetical protein
MDAFQVKQKTKIKNRTKKKTIFLPVLENKTGKKKT